MADDIETQVQAVVIKHCRRCNLSKIFSDFSVNKRTVDRLQDWCKSCFRAYLKKRIKHYPEKARAYRVANADSIKLVAAAYYKKNYQEICKQQADYRAKNTKTIKAKWRRYNITQASEIKARRAIYKIANPESKSLHQRNRRARLRNATGRHTATDLKRLFTIQAGRCAHTWCRAPLKAGYHVDHVKPLARGGSNDRKNLQLLCASCNWSKNARDPIEYAQENGLLL